MAAVGWTIMVAGTLVAVLSDPVFVAVLVGYFGLLFGVIAIVFHRKL